MTNTWCVRTEFGTCTKHFIEGGYLAIGWMPNTDLSAVESHKVKVFVQAKRYKLGRKVNASTVKQLRQAIPFGGPGAFTTTAEFQGAAADAAVEPGFPRIGLIHGRQLVDLLIDHRNDIPLEFREQMGLRPGLVRT